MEQGEKFSFKLNNLQTALTQFNESLKIDLIKLNPVERDTIMNGQIQKFEICIELFWKAIQLFLREKHGIDTVSPKSTVKEFFNITDIDEITYETLLQMIDDRNKLSHIYNEIFFKEIYARLKDYSLILNNISNSLN